MLAEYEHALLLRFDGIPGRENARPEDVPEDFHPCTGTHPAVNRTVHMLEKTAFYDGFYKAFASAPIRALLRALRGRGVRGTVDESVRRKCGTGPGPPQHGGGGHGRFRDGQEGGLDIHTIPCKDLEYGKVTSSTCFRRALAPGMMEPKVR
jgi:hypothetical protein